MHVKRRRSFIFLAFWKIESLCGLLRRRSEPEIDGSPSLSGSSSTSVIMLDVWADSQCLYNTKMTNDRTTKQVKINPANHQNDLKPFHGMNGEAFPTISFPAWVINYTRYFSIVCKESALLHLTTLLFQFLLSNYVIDKISNNLYDARYDSHIHASFMW